MSYEIRGIEPKDYGDEIAGGDDEFIREIPLKRTAQSFAKLESKKKKWHEVMIIKRDPDGDDPIFQEYYSKGKLKDKMF